MSSERWVEEGKNLIGKVRFEEAERCFEQALQEDPKSADASVWLGWLYFMKLENEPALAFVESALQTDPHNPRALALKGIAELQAGKMDEAVALLEEARNIDAGLQMIYASLARAYRLMDRMSEAEHAAQEAIRLNPSDFLARCELSYILGRTGRLKEAIEELLECIRINPLFGKAYLILGEVYRRAGLEASAILIYRKALEENPKAFPIREVLCDFFAQKSDYASAYNEAVQLVIRRNQPSDYVRLGTYAIAIGAREKAVKAFGRARELDPQKWWVFSPDEIYDGNRVPRPEDRILLQVTDHLKGSQL